MQKYSIELTKIQEILDENPQGLTVQDISKIININRNSVAKYLDILHFSGNATLKNIGPAKVFFPSKIVPIENIMNYSTDLFMVINDKTKIINVNEQFANFIGKTKEEIIYLKIEDIQIKCNLTKEEMKTITTCIGDALAGNQAIAELRCQKKRWFKVKFIPTKIDEKKSGVTIILEDITEKKEAIDKLEKINTELSEERQLFVKGPIVIFKWLNKNDWPVEYVSNNVEIITGYTPEEFRKGKIKYADLIHEDDFLRVSYEARRYERKGIEQFEHKPYRIVTKNNKEKWVNVHTLIIRDKNKQIKHYLCHLIDITNFFNIFEEIKQRKK